MDFTVSLSFENDLILDLFDLDLLGTIGEIKGTVVRYSVNE